MKRLFGAAVVALFAFGCGGGDPGNTGAADAGGGGGGGGTGACAAQYAGCTAYTAEDGGTPVIEFGGALANTYSPKCLKVPKGTTVRFSGAFGVHPLAQGCGPAALISNGQNTEPKDIVFDTAGIFGYWCTAHGTATGAGMAGSIEVTP